MCIEWNRTRWRWQQQRRRLRRRTHNKTRRSRMSSCVCIYLCLCVSAVRAIRSMYRQLWFIWTVGIRVGAKRLQAVDCEERERMRVIKRMSIYLVERNFTRLCISPPLACSPCKHDFRMFAIRYQRMALQSRFHSLKWSEMKWLRNEKTLFFVVVDVQSDVWCNFIQEKKTKISMRKLIMKMQRVDIRNNYTSTKNQWDRPFLCKHKRSPSDSRFFSIECSCRRHLRFSRDAACSNVRSRSPPEIFPTQNWHRMVFFHPAIERTNHGLRIHIHKLPTKRCSMQAISIVASILVSSQASTMDLRWRKELPTSLPTLTNFSVFILVNFQIALSSSDVRTKFEMLIVSTCSRFVRPTLRSWSVIYVNVVIVALRQCVGKSFAIPIIQR